MCGSVLRSPGYPAALLVRLKDLYDKGQLCDFSLIANNTEVRVHSVVLLGASNHFRKMMDEGSLQEPRYCLQTASVECLQRLVEFMYTGSLLLSQDSIWIILALASQLDIPEVIDLCQNYLEGLDPAFPDLQSCRADVIPDSGVQSTFNPAEMWMDKVPEVTEHPANVSAGEISNHGNQGIIKQEACEQDLVNSISFVSDNNTLESYDLADFQSDPDYTRTVFEKKKQRKTTPRKRKNTKRESDLDFMQKESELDLLCEEVIVTPRRRGRPKGSKNRDKTFIRDSPRKRGRPRKPESCELQETSSQRNMQFALTTVNFDSPFSKVSTVPRGKSSHKCSLCGMTFLWHCLLLSHQKMHFMKHFQYLRSSCLLRKCSWNTFTNATKSSSSSQTSTEPYQCSKCPKTFKLCNNVKTHMLKKHTTLRGSYKCRICSPHKSFTANKYLFLHTFRHHRRSLDPTYHRSKYWKCFKCSRQFLHRVSLQEHSSTAHEDKTEALHSVQAEAAPKTKKWACEEVPCSFVTFSKRGLLDHLQKDHPSVHYSCPQCRFDTSIKALLERHYDRSHGNQHSSNICEICGKMFPRSSRLRLHMFSKHKIHDPGLTVYRCPRAECEYACPFKDGINRHMLKHQSDKPFSCSICAKRFKTEKSVEKHMNKVHLGIRNFVCDVCGMAYGEDAELKIHMARHSNVKTHHCQHCDYATFDKGNYKTHLYGKHGIKLVEDMKIFQCTLCEFSTSTKYRYSDHMRVHYEVRDIPCPHCDKLFMTRKAMQGHIKKVHNPKEFRCDICTYITSDRSKLRDHVRIMHTHRNFKPYKCPYCSFQCATGGNCRKHVKHRHKDKEIRYLKLDPTAAVVEVAAMETKLAPDDPYQSYVDMQPSQNATVSRAMNNVMLPGDGSGVNLIQTMTMGGVMSDGLPAGGTYDNSAVTWHSFNPMMQHEGQV